VEEKENRKIKEKIKKIADRRRDLSRVFQDEEDFALLKLELLKLNSIYIKFFSKYRDKVAAAYAGRLADDEEVWDTVAHFYGGLKYRFGIDVPSLRPCATHIIACDDLLTLLDPETASEEIPAEVRRFFLPRMFFTPGITLVSDDPDGKTVAIKFRNKKKAQLLEEFAAFLDFIEASYDMFFDRSRKREETRQHLTVWRMRRQIPMPSYPEIAKKLGITEAAAKKSVYRAFELIYGKPFDRKAWEKDRAEKHSKTCANCLQREGCTEPCPDIFEERISTREYLAENIAEISDSHSYNEWLTREED
jgi:hypothetical protein